MIGYVVIGLIGVLSAFVVLWLATGRPPRRWVVPVTLVLINAGAATQNPTPTDVAFLIAVSVGLSVAIGAYQFLNRSREA